MSDTTHLALPYIDPAQSQKHVTHNEALSLLDLCVHLSVVARNVTAPPASPSEGARYLVGSGATGAFAEKAQQIAAYQDGGWRFLQPRAGWRAYVESDSLLFVYEGSSWAPLNPAIDTLQNMLLLGVGTTADATNPFAAKLNAALFAARTTADGGSGDLRYKLNKEGATHTVSQLYQSNFSGRAETGLIGDDHFRIKVSADGGAWTSAVDIDPATGVVSFPAGVSGLTGGITSFVNKLVNGNFLINQRAYASGGSLGAGAYAHDRWKAGASGCSYTFTPGVPDTMITITSGSLMQVVEDVNIEAGTYTLSWSGSAAGRVNGGTYAASPLTVSLSSGSASVEFGAGTLGCAVLAKGSTAIAFERRPAAIETILCQRYYYRRVGVSAYDVVGMMSAFASNAAWGKFFDFPVEMRAAPAITLSSVSHLSVWNASGSTPFPGVSAGSITASRRSAAVFGAFYVSGSPGWSAGQAVFMTFNTTSGWISADAEL